MAHTRPNAIEIIVEKKEGNEVRKIRKILVQKPAPIINRLTLEGCGVRGTAIAGAIKILEKYGLLPDIETVAGTSAGAIAGLIIALGFTASEGTEILKGMPLKEFMEGSESWSTTPEAIAKLRQGLSILFGKDHSLSPGIVFLEWLESIVARRFDKIFQEKGIKKAGKDATFRDLVNLIEETKENGQSCPYKYLYVTATDLSISSPECKFFSHENPVALDMRLADAVRKSGGFPAMFKLFESLLDHHKYADGGMMMNLPDIFEEARFDPPGYKHEKHANPGNLCIKVDTIKEIKQFIWGIYEEVPVETATETADALYKAVSETTSARKVREARLVLPLPDGNIQTLQFSIDNQGKVKLITSAEKTTQEFLENYVNAAYEVEVYDSIEDWLEPPKKYEFRITANKILEPQPDKIYIEKIDNCLRYTVRDEQGKIITDDIPQEILNHSFKDPLTLDELEPFMQNILKITAKRGHTALNPKSLDEIDDIILAYTKMKDELAAESKKVEISSLDAINHDPNQPTIKELEEQINFFEEYYNYRRCKKRNPNLEPNFKFPAHHINLPPPKAGAAWNLNVIKDMEMRLDGINTEIERINELISHNYSNLIGPDVIIKATNLHSDIFDDVKHLVGFTETLKLLYEEKTDLENKLNIKEDKKVKLENKFNFNSKNENAEKESSKEFELFCQQMQPLLLRKDLSSGFKAILDDLDLFDPKVNYKSMNEIDNIVFSLDLRNPDDRKLYMAASYLYLENKKYKDLAQFKKMFATLFGNDSSLKTIGSLSAFLDKSGAELCCALYRIEELLHWFEKREKLAQKLDIDNILGLRTWSVFNKKPKPKEHEGLELITSYKSLSRTEPENLTNAASPQFSIFDTTKKETAKRHAADEVSAKNRNAFTGIEQKPKMEYEGGSSYKVHPLEMSIDDELEQQFNKSLSKINTPSN